MFTAPALRSVPDGWTVRSVAQLRRGGWTDSGIRAQLRARRWQRAGRAVVLHNAVLDADERRQVALLNAGPRAALTSFTALEAWGLTNWSREAVHVLVPGGARITRPPGVPMRVHWTGDWPSRDVNPRRQLHKPAEAAVLAAASASGPRPACGVLAAVVQQRLVEPERLLRALVGAPRCRHRAVLLAAARDIAQGAEALSEIDFAVLCRRGGLPEPTRQAVRSEPSGRRRYLDVEWERERGRRLVVEIDGALHLAATRWWNDQLRQNELVLAGDRVLRFPSVVVRCEPHLVLDQLRRALAG